MGAMGNADKILDRKLKDYLGDIGIDGRTVLKLFV
jgi:hypothetical protein